MYRLRRELFTGTALAQDQDVRVASSQKVELIAEVPTGDAFTHHPEAIGASEGDRRQEIARGDRWPVQGALDAQEQELIPEQQGPAHRQLARVRLVTVEDHRTASDRLNRDLIIARTQRELMTRELRAKEGLGFPELPGSVAVEDEALSGIFGS